MIECVGHVKRWHSGDTCPPWTAAGMLGAGLQFRRIIGCRDLAKLVTAIEREVAPADHPTSATKEVTAEPVEGTRP